MMNQRGYWLSLVLVALVFSASVAHGQEVTPEALRDVCWVYTVSVQGNMLNGTTPRRFKQTGMLYVVSGTQPNSEHVVDLALLLGAPVGHPEKGALVYTSNAYYVDGLSGYYRNGSFDLGSVSTEHDQSNTAVVYKSVLSSDLAANFDLNHHELVNVYNWDTLEFANFKVVVGGGLAIKFLPDGSLVGEISLIGQDWTSYGPDSNYDALLAGQQLKITPDANDCVIKSR